MGWFGDTRTRLAAPDKISQLDLGSLDRVITVSKQMMGPKIQYALWS